MQVSHEQMIAFYRTMKRIRIFEERASLLSAGNKIPGTVHLYIGEEAVAAGVCANLTASDYIVSTHRGHGHLIAKGGDPKFMMAELFGKSTGYCKGKGGSMHIADMDLGILGANGIVGGGPPIAAGAALAAQYKGTDAVCVCFFGDGASNQGTTHEAMNLAACWKLPVVFMVENNQFGEFTPQSKHQTIEDVAERAAGYNIPGVIVDGNDVLAVYEAASEAVALARKGGGPSLVECKTYRVRGHFEGDPMAYRDEEQAKEWLAKDPIMRFEEKLMEMGILTQKQIEAMIPDIEKEMEEAVAFAEQSPFPDPSELMTDVYSD
jgi:pyruvate dehydrogenase E1 component alpha subunit